MLAARQRLRRRTDFTAAVRAGRRAGRGGLVVHLLPGAYGPNVSGSGTTDSGVPGSGESGVTPAGGGVRAGFVVPRSVGGAVARNRVRRRLRHLVRVHLAQLPPGTDLVVRVLPSAAARTYQELDADLAAAIAAASSRSTTGRPAKVRRGQTGGGSDD